MTLKENHICKVLAKDIAMAAKKEDTKAKRGSWICSKGHYTGGRASVCKVCGEPKPIKKQKKRANIDLLLKTIGEAGGLSTLKQLVADANAAEEKLAAFGGIPGAEQAIADFVALQKTLEDAAK